jgi:hypothetical protein
MAMSALGKVIAKYTVTSFEINKQPTSSIKLALNLNEVTRSVLIFFMAQV